MKTPISVPVIAVCGLLVVFGLAGFQQTQVAKLRRDSDRLRAEQSASRPSAGAGDESAAEGGHREEIQRLRSENRELHRLRNDVRELRDRKRELDKMRAENERLRAAKPIKTTAADPSSPPAVFVPKSNWQNAGTSTPEATVQTFFWAARERSLPHLVNCVSPEMRSRLETEVTTGQEPKIFDEMASMLQQMEGLYLAGREKMSGNDSVVLVIQSSPNGPAMKFPLQLIGNEWKLAEKR